MEKTHKGIKLEVHTVKTVTFADDQAMVVATQKKLQENHDRVA